MFKRLTAGALGAGLIAATVFVAQPAAALPPNSSSTYTIHSTSSAVIDVGTVQPNFRITIARGHGTTTCGHSCTATYTDGSLSGSNTPCPTSCLAPGLPTGAIIVKEGTDPWYVYNFSPDKIQSDVAEHILVAYNDSNYANNSGTYVDLFVARESTLPTPSVPDLPTGFAISKNVAAHSATVTWAPPPWDGGSAITGYRVARTGKDSTGAGPWSTVVAATARSLTFTKLLTGASYTFTVQAINAVGTGSAASGTVTMAVTAPGAPTGFTVTKNFAARSATITWARPAADGGSAITGYRVARNGKDSTGAGPWSTVLPATARSQTFTKLLPGSSYTLTVQAVNSAGSGATATGTITMTSP